MSKETKRAPLIVIEGLDRSGKTTQTATLCARLQSAGTPAHLQKFPDRTTAIGKMIDAYLSSTAELDDRAVHLLFSANRWELASTLEQAVRAGTPVICDRYAFSGIAFSAAKVADDDDDAAAAAAARAPLIPFEWCRAPDVGLPAPDLVLFFDIAPEDARARGGYGEERYEREEVQCRVREQFRRIGAEMGQSGGDTATTIKTGTTKWVVIDAGRDREVVAEEVWSHVGPLVKQGIEGPLNRLWAE